MYELDFNTATIDDVITRSIVCHPTMLIDTLRANASIHFNARDTMHDREAKEAAQRSGQQCRTAANNIALGTGRDKLTFGERLAAFFAATKLQCLPYSVSNAICARDDATRAAA